MRAQPWRLVAAAMLAAMAGPGLACAEADGPDCYAVRGVAAGDVLNIRAEPSAAAAKVGEIPPDGRGIRNLGCQGEPTFEQWQSMSKAERERAGRQRWCKVRYRGVDGWVAGRYLAEDSASAAPDAVGDGPGTRMPEESGGCGGSPAPSAGSTPGESPRERQ
ncbi:MAG: SH3 domain-containing protein [Rhodospirillales bacterium]|nr:SH3 domain-containing protein [Rhodospirillales bacterium]